MKRLHHSDWMIASAIFAGAFVLRLVFLLNSPDREWPHSILYEGDAPTWVAWATALDRGAAFEFDLPLRSPAVAYLLSWLSLGEVGPPFTPLKIVWCGFTALTCALTYLAAAMAFNRRIGLIAAGLCSFSFGSYIISSSLNNEALYGLLLAAIVLLTMFTMHRASTWRFAGLGTLHGMALLVRPEHALFVAFFAGYMLWMKTAPSRVEVDRTLRPMRPHWRVGLVHIGLMLTVSIAVCSPWMIRGAKAVHRYNTISPNVIDYNASSIPWSFDARAYLDALPAFTRQGSFGAATYYNQSLGKSDINSGDVERFFLEVYGYIPEPISQWSLVSMKGPLDFALANHPASDGGFTKAAMAGPGEPDPLLQLDRPDHLRLINHGYAAGWNFIRRDFIAWFNLVGSKLTRFFDGVSLGLTSRNLPLGSNGQRRSVDLFTTTPTDRSSARLTASAWKIVIAAMILCGFVICCIRQRGGIWLLIIAYKLIVSILFYGYARQAVSIHPAYFLLMAVSVDQLVFWVGKWWTPSRRTSMIAVTVVLLALLMIDVTGSLRRPHLTIVGPTWLTPQWGPDAFQSHQTIRLEVTSRPTP